MVDHRKIDVPGEKVFADSLGDVGVDLVFVENARLLELLEYRAIGVDAPDLDAWVLLLEKPADTRRRAPCANADNQMGNPAVGLPPDLRSGLFVVGGGVRQVV